MNLNIFKDMNNKKDGFISNFINELKRSIELGSKSDIGILDKIQNENNVSIGTKNKMDIQLDEILVSYANETLDKGDLYFIVEKSLKDNKYVTYKYENGNDSVIKLLDKELPENAGVNSILRFKENRYILDKEDTLEIENRLTEMANELLKEQEKMLKDYRREGHLYRVSENINDCVFLWDITEKPEDEIEEVDFPKELLHKATEGAVFEYTNGEYRLKE